MLDMSREFRSLIAVYIQNSDIYVVHPKIV